MDAPSTTDRATGNFSWERQAPACALLQRWIAEASEDNALIATLAQRLHDQTGTRLFDWIDTITLLGTPPVVSQLEQTGFVEEDVEARRGFRYYRHAGGLFPPRGTDGRRQGRRGDRPAAP